MNTPILGFEATLPKSTDKILSSFTPCTDEETFYPSPLPTFYPSIILSTPSQYAYLPQSPQSAGSSSSSSRGLGRTMGNQAVLYSPWCPDTPPHGERDSNEEVEQVMEWPQVLESRWERSYGVATTQDSLLEHQDVPNGETEKHPLDGVAGCSIWSEFNCSDSDEVIHNVEGSSPPSNIDEMDFEPRSLSFPSAPQISSIEMFDDTPLLLDFDADERYSCQSPEHTWTERQLRSPWLAGDIVGADEFLQGDGMVERERRLGRSNALGGGGMVGLGFGP